MAAGVGVGKTHSSVESTKTKPGSHKQVERPVVFELAAPLPVGHAEQDVAPAAGLKKPAAQAEHDVAPAAALKLPAAHEAQPTTLLQRPVVVFSVPLAAPVALAAPASQRQSAGPLPLPPKGEKEKLGHAGQVAPVPSS